MGPSAFSARGSRPTNRKDSTSPASSRTRACASAASRAPRALSRCGIRPARSACARPESSFSSGPICTEPPRACRGCSSLKVGAVRCSGRRESAMAMVASTVTPSAACGAAHASASVVMPTALLPCRSACIRTTCSVRGSRRSNCRATAGAPAAATPKATPVPMSTTTPAASCSAGRASFCWSFRRLSVAALSAIASACAAALPAAPAGASKTAAPALQCGPWTARQYQPAAGGRCR